MSNLVRKDWFWVATVGVLLIMMQWMHFSPIYTVDHAIYDASLSGLHKSTGSADKIAIITIHKSDLTSEDSALSLKEGLTSLLVKLRKSESKSIAILAPVADMQSMAGLSYLDEAEDYLQGVKLSRKDKQSFSSLLGQARSQMDVDKRLANQTAKLNKVYFPFHVSHEADMTPVFTHAYALRADDKGSQPIKVTSALLGEQKRNSAVIYDHGWPIDSLISAARGLGYLSQVIDTDGVTRSVQVVQPYQDKWIASLPLMLAANMLSVPMKQVSFTPGKHVKVGDRVIPVDYQNQMYPNFYSASDETESVFSHYSYTDIISGKTSLRDLRKKLVLIDAPEFLPSEATVTPVGEASGIAEVIAHTVTSILNQDIYAHLQGLQWVEFALFIAIGLYLALLLPRLSFSIGFFITSAVLFVLLGAEIYLLLSSQSWLHAGMAIIFLSLGYMVVAAKHVFNLQRVKHVQEISFTNRQLGLLLQEQGKLEQAFDCFQKLPANTDNLDLIYNLALDFERKRKFNNAVRAFHFIMDHKKGFRDVKQRLERAQQVEHSTTLGTGQFHSLGALLVEGKGEKPMLGRFVIEKELGKGAMGAVYLGRDPKINRVVAVKTLALSQEFESDEIKEVESRFFHEASAAGRLNHPNIVTIYDAAEDHDLAYIAMEYIEGEPLSDYVKQDSLLPIPLVLSIIAKMADALEYAGSQGIIHRDIKPANIMYNREKNIVKITDFGIARISSSGRTRTGMILGTPSYMSPEQMNGEHVDSRSDIFSLGVTMFVMLTGHKAFPGDSLAAISYKIVNEKHPDITTIRKELPVSVKKVIDKALQKNPDKRYQSGIVMKRAVLRCLKEVSEQ